MNRHRRHPVPSMVLLGITLAVPISLLAPEVRAFSPRTLISPTGDATYSSFGSSVSDAGDVNGDGYGDVIVGADQYSNWEGRVDLFYGGPGADALPDFTMPGEFASDFLGTSVSGAGDVNGDGYADVIVGAYGNDAGGEDAGQAYIYFGGAAAGSYLILTGEAAGDFFGIEVSGAGDVNGDGYDDVLVGAPRNDAGGSAAGRAYLFFGGAVADAVADLTFTGGAPFDQMGTVSDAGDVNGDGYGDWIVGSPFDDAGGPPGTDLGRAYVYFGGPVPDAAPEMMLNGEATNDAFGGEVSGAGDVNGDGYGDVIVGAWQNDAGGASAGRAYIYYGSAFGVGADLNADIVVTGEAAGDLLGSSVSGAGDVNGDGYDDVVVGAPSNDAGGLQAGRTYVYYGGPAADNVADLTSTGAAMDDRQGNSVSGAGDFNGDGYDDVIVGARGSDRAAIEAGQAHVITSRPYEVLSPDGGEQWIVGREQRVRWLGADPADLWISFDGGAGYTLLASAVGGGQQNMFALTAPSHETATAKIRVSASGEPVTHASSDVTDGVFSILVPHLPPTAAHRLQLTLTGEAGGDSFGASVGSAGDVNGDGYVDVIVGAPGYSFSQGRAYVYHGGPDADMVADLVLTGEAADNTFGNSVGAAGDVNGDGYGDVIVGATGYGGYQGRAYVYYGGPGADAVSDLTLTGAVDIPNFSFSVGSAGDVNGDGYGDVIVGANGYNGYQGRAFVYHGGPGADATADLTLTGEGSLNSFGASVGSAGDVNGDGHSDLIVGAPGYDDSRGRAYVYYGGPGADAVADLKLTGEAASNHFGRSVGSAGDVNGDGRSDLIVGAFGYSGQRGRAYVYYGGPGADTAADQTLTGEAAGHYFGWPVGAAGDVNADGYGDVIVAATQYNSAQGRAYVYYGGPGADAAADLTLTGAAEYSYFGASVGTAGDVNGNGYADVIVGAYGYIGYQGRAYVYDFNRYLVTAPNGGETWNVGAMKTISWLGAEPADVWLSVDGGNTHELVETAVGGASMNSLAIRVPHTPSKFARIRLTPSDAGIGGSDRSDSLFTIQTSVSLLALLAAPLPQGGAAITWRTDPGPEDLSGYRLERGTGGAGGWQVLVALTRETSYTDPSGGPGSQYRLFAVNGFGEEMWLGEASLRPSARLAAWPLPYRGGNLSVSFATASAVGGGPAPAKVDLYDVRGRLIRAIKRGVHAAGHHSAVWDGRDNQGREVPAGIYFLRAESGGHVERLKLAVLR